MLCVLENSLNILLLLKRLVGCDYLNLRVTIITRIVTSGSASAGDIVTALEPLEDLPLENEVSIPG